MTDYRALCAELVELCTPVDSIPQLAERLQKLNALADRARALLAEQPVSPPYKLPEPEGPSAEDLDKSFQQWWYEEGSIGPMSGMDYEEHTKRISRIAWHNGAYFTLQRLPAPEATNE